MDPVTLQKITDDLIRKLKALEEAPDFEDAQDAAVRAAMDTLLAHRGKVPQPTGVEDEELIAELAAKKAELQDAIAKNAKLAADILTAQLAIQKLELDTRAAVAQANTEKMAAIQSMLEQMQKTQQDCRQTIETFKRQIDELEKNLAQARKDALVAITLDSPPKPTVSPAPTGPKGTIISIPIQPQPPTGPKGTIISLPIEPQRPVLSEAVDSFENRMKEAKWKNLDDLFAQALLRNNVPKMFQFLEGIFEEMLEFYAGTIMQKSKIDALKKSTHDAATIRILLKQYATKIIQSNVSDNLRIPFEDAMAFLLIKFATGREYISKDTVTPYGIKETQRKKDLLLFSEDPPVVQNADNNMFKSFQLSGANDKIPMTREIARAFYELFTIFLTEPDKKILNDAAALPELYPTIFSSDFILFRSDIPDDIGPLQLRILNKMTAAAYVAETIDNIYFANALEKERVRSIQILLFSMVINGGFDREPTSNKPIVPETNLFRALGRRPRYDLKDDIQFLKSYGKPAVDLLEMDLPIAKMSIANAVSSANVAEIAVSVMHAVRNNDTTQLTAGLVAAAKAGMHEAVPMFADARHLLTEADWTSAMDAAETEEMYNHIAKTAGIIAKGRGFLSNLKKELQRIADKESMTMAGQFVQALLLDNAVQNWLASDPMPVKTVLVMANMKKPTEFPYGAFILDGKYTGKELLQRFSIRKAGGIKNLAESTTAFDIEKSGIIRATPDRMIMKVGDVEVDIPNTFTTKFEAKSGNIVYIEGTWKNTSKSNVSDGIDETPIVESTASVSSIANNAVSGIAKAKTDDEAWFAVTGIHEWLTELQLGTKGAPSLKKLIPSGEWSAATAQIRSALEQRQYSTEDSTAWQQYESLINRYI